MRNRSFPLAFALLSGSVLLFALEVPAQSYTPIYAPKSDFRVYASCMDGAGNVIPYCGMCVNTGAWVYTNSHIHDDYTHLYSTFKFDSDPPGTARTYACAYAAADGYLPLNMTGTLVGQAELVCNTAFGTTACLNYAIGYSDVYYNDHPEIWIKIGASDTGKDTGHGTTVNNRYMMSGPAYGLYYATLDYLAATGQSQVCTNDMALPFGGKFDISLSSRWQSPHVEHDRGTAVDVAGPGSGQCATANQVNIDQFVQACKDRGATIYSINEGNHAHCNWASPSTYPH